MSRVKAIRLTAPRAIQPFAVKPSSSKSESNRALIINALSGGRADLLNLSDARDTKTMTRLLSSSDDVLDVLDAGTTMRFLTAYLPMTTKKVVILTGSERMQNRPIEVLVDGLVKLGAEIEYTGKTGYPPLRINPFSIQKSTTLEVPGNISSQYVSALLMIAPILPKGLTLLLTGEIYSRPYIEMTLSLMKTFGVDHFWEGNRIVIEPQPYKEQSYTIESDWSGASYWFSFASMGQANTLSIDGLREQSNQGDQAIVDIMKHLGVNSAYIRSGVELSPGSLSDELSLDFKACPDLAQTVVVAAAAKGVDIEMTGLESLKIKETDRIAALQTELAKVNVDLVETAGKWTLNTKYFSIEPNAVFDTYEDHRMAMAFAPLCLLTPIIINEPEVVKKSYPGYWEDLKLAGVRIEEI